MPTFILLPSCRSDGRPEKSVPCPIAAITMSASRTNVSPVGTGLLLPEASGSPSSIFSQRMRSTLRAPSIVFGAAR